MSNVNRNKKIAWILSSTSLNEEVGMEVGISNGFDCYSLREFYNDSDAERYVNNFRSVLYDFENLPALISTAHELQTKAGKAPDYVVAMDEYSLLAAAEIRNLFRIPGQSIKQLLPFRDKRCSHSILNAADIPTTRRLSKQDLVLWDFNSNPVIAKPATGAGSKGVRFLSSPDDLIGQDEVLEEWQVGPVIHVDGLTINSKLVFVKVSTYDNATCFGYSQGKPLTSRTLSNQSKDADLVIQMTKRVLDLLKPPDGSFHCEFIIDNAGTPVFLEIAARPGGGFIVESIEAATGINLRVQHTRAALGLSVDTEVTKNYAAGFWLLPVPKGSNQNSVVTDVRADILLDSQILDSSFPSIGEPIGSPDDYRDALAYAVLVAVDEETVKNDMDRLTGHVKVSYK